MAEALSAEVVASRMEVRIAGVGINENVREAAQEASDVADEASEAVDKAGDAIKDLLGR